MMLHRKRDFELTSFCLKAADLDYATSKLTSSPNTRSLYLPLGLGGHFSCRLIQNLSKFCLDSILRYQVVATFDKLLARCCWSCWIELDSACWFPITTTQLIKLSHTVFYPLWSEINLRLECLILVHSKSKGKF